MGEQIERPTRPRIWYSCARPRASARSTIERVRLRDVEAGLDDRRRDENVGVSAQEGEHLLLELALAHLPVPDRHPQSGDELPDPVGGHVDRLHAVVQVERLAPSRDLALEGRLDELLVVLADVRADRPAALGRRLDDRDVAQSRERHVQRARDRGRGQGEHVDLEPERAEQLLLRDAEALFLIDDHEAELLRNHVAREDAVRSDQDVDLAGLEVGQDPLDVGRLAEARDHLDMTGKSR